MKACLPTSPAVDTAAPKGRPCSTDPSSNTRAAMRTGPGPGRTRRGGGRCKPHWNHGKTARGSSPRGSLRGTLGKAGAAVSSSRFTGRSATAAAAQAAGSVRGGADVRGGAMSALRRRQHPKHLKNPIAQAQRPTPSKTRANAGRLSLKRKKGRKGEGTQMFIVVNSTSENCTSPPLLLNVHDTLGW